LKYVALEHRIGSGIAGDSTIFNKVRGKLGCDSAAANCCSPWVFFNKKNRERKEGMKKVKNSIAE